MNKEWKTFGGTATEITKDEMEEVWYDEKFTKAGKQSFLKSINIPYSYFTGQSENIKSILLKNGLEQLKAKTQNPFLVLKDKLNKISYTKLRFKVDSDIELKEPDVLLKNYKKILVKGDFLTSGKESIYYGIKELDSKNSTWNAISLDVRPFWDMSTKLESSLLTIRCKNGMIDQENVEPLSIPIKNLSQNVLQTSFKAMSSLLIEKSSLLIEQTDKLKNHIVNFSETQEIVEILFMKNIIPKIAYDNITKYLIAHGIIKGYLGKSTSFEIDPESWIYKHQKAPVQFKNYWDVVNLSTYFVSNFLPANSRKQYETKIFSYFYSDIKR